MIAWPWKCVSCGQRYAAYRVYARAGYERQEYLVCAECGPNIPSWVRPPHDGWSDVYHTILRPVPEVFDPVVNPYPRPEKKASSEKRPVKPLDKELLVA